jgi:hypothetical protein
MPAFRKTLLKKRLKKNQRFQNFRILTDFFTNSAPPSKFFYSSDETFAKPDSSIRVQPITGLRRARLKREPRGGSRGALTRNLSGR